MNHRPPFRYCEPTFFAGLLDDPLLLVHIRPLGKSLLFDCGTLHHLAKRVLKSISAIFISHAHMDHFMGMDTFIRHNHVSPKTVEIFGPPGITTKMAAKFASYDWNLYEPYWCSFRVHEISRELISTSLFAGPEGFACRKESIVPRSDPVVFWNSYVQVEAEQCDHKIPVLIFRITEQPAFLIDGEKVRLQGLIPGGWLRELKKKMLTQAPGGIAVLRQQGEEVWEEVVGDLNGLYQAIRRFETPASIGYVTDIAFTRENQERCKKLLNGVRLLVCENSFLAEDLDKARVSRHLCTSDVRELAASLSPRYLLPMHLSKTYIHRSFELYEQLQGMAGTTILKLPDHLAPRPLLRNEVPSPWEQAAAG